MEKKNKIRFVATILVLVVILIIVLNYEDITEFIRGVIIDIFKINSDDLCDVPSCNPKNNNQYCLDGKWIDCNPGEICINEECKSSQGISNGNKGENEAIPSEGIIIPCIGEECESEGAEAIGESIYKYILTIKKKGTGFGTVTTNNGFTCEVEYEQCTVNYADITIVTATANPLEASSVFTGWSGCDSLSNNICNVNLNSNDTITVYFDFIPET